MRWKWREMVRKRVSKSVRGKKVELERAREREG